MNIIVIIIAVVVVIAARIKAEYCCMCVVDVFSIYNCTCKWVCLGSAHRRVSL